MLELKLIYKRSVVILSIASPQLLGTAEEYSAHRGQCLEAEKLHVSIRLIYLKMLTIVWVVSYQMHNQTPQYES